MNPATTSWSSSARSDADVVCPPLILGLVTRSYLCGFLLVTRTAPACSCRPMQLATSPLGRRRVPDGRRVPTSGPGPARMASARRHQAASGSVRARLTVKASAFISRRDWQPMPAAIVQAWRPDPYGSSCPTGFPWSGPLTAGRGREAFFTGSPPRSTGRGGGDGCRRSLVPL
jgi:hypothetical protein